jgi:hypothetical protein
MRLLQGSRQCSSKSPALERRAALFHKGSHPLPRVMGCDDAGEGTLLNREAVVNRGIHATVDRGQRRGQSEGWFGGQLLCKKARYLSLHRRGAH